MEWQSAEGAHVQGGFTQDVSVRGLCVISERIPPVGTPVYIRVVLPISESLSKKVTHLEAVGVVARVLSREEGPGIAFSAELNFKFSLSEVAQSVHSSL
jgi:hypothetical protein